MKIAQILGVNQKKIKDWQYISFMTWADTYSMNHRELQKILINQMIYNWFCSEYQKLENEFKEIVKPYLNSDKRDLAKMYSDVTSNIIYVFPSALDIKPVHKKTITTKYSLN